MTPPIAVPPVAPPPFAAPPVATPPGVPAADASAPGSFPPPAPLPGTQASAPSAPFGGGDVESGSTMRFSPAALQREIAERRAEAAPAAHPAGAEEPVVAGTSGSGASADGGAPSGTTDAAASDATEPRRED
ncbi:topoisomerase II, partial [Streptomyces sp. SID6041]|nr:topoisomerase II [Streptomyces sp. SID6041]